MPAYSKSLKADIAKRIDEGKLKVSGNFAKRANSSKRMYALGRLEARRMNKTELAYSQYLDALKAAGSVLWWEFEGVKLRLADNTYYTPDFFLMLSNGELQVHETKGFMMDDANVKLKVAAEKFPWPFFLVKKAKEGTWGISKIGNKSEKRPSIN